MQKMIEGESKTYQRQQKENKIMSLDVSAMVSDVNASKMKKMER